MTVRPIRGVFNFPSASRELTTRCFALPQTGGVRALDFHAPLSLVLVVVILVVAVHDPAAAVVAASVLLPTATVTGHFAVRYLRIRQD